MGRRSWRPVVGALAVAAAVGASSAAGASAAPQDGDSDSAEQPYIVVLDDGENAHAASRRFERQYRSEVRHVYDAALDGFAASMTPGQADAVARQRGVQRVQPDGVVAVATADHETAPNGILRTESWTAHQRGHDGRTPERVKVRIVVLDTGIKADHVDLAPNINPAAGIDCIEPGTAPDDDHGHGTHVAGTAAGAYAGTGVVGVATDAELVAAKVLDSTGYGTDSQVICGIDHAVALAADGVPTIINVSLGEARTEDWAGLGCASSAMHEAVCNASAAGVTVVAAAGNDGADASGFVPAAFPEAIAVSGFSDLDGERSFAGCSRNASYGYECDDHLASFTNHGSVIDLAAPGVNIYSSTVDGAWATKNGTSMAAPHVAGAAALIRAANPQLTPAEVRQILWATGECPDGSQADAADACTGKGGWMKSDGLFSTTSDPDGIAEPLLNSRRAATEAYRRTHAGGDWVGSYGADGHSLAAWDGTTDLVDLPAALTVEQGSRTQWSASTADTRALEDPSGTVRRAGAWTDSTDLRLRLDFTGSYTGNLHLYAVDWPDANRRQTITVEHRGLTTTVALPWAFETGHWTHVPVKVAAGDSITVSVAPTTAHDAVVSGLFLGDQPVVDPYPVKPLHPGER